MPYIKQNDRIRLQPILDEFNKATIINPGELNYIITKECIKYLLSQNTSPGYLQYNEVIGVLECVKQELYRRIFVNYENRKITENGDVY